MPNVRRATASWRPWLSYMLALVLVLFSLPATASHFDHLARIPAMSADSGVAVETSQQDGPAGTDKIHGRICILCPGAQAVQPHAGEWRVFRDVTFFAFHAPAEHPPVARALPPLLRPPRA